MHPDLLRRPLIVAPYTVRSVKHRSFDRPGGEVETEAGAVSERRPPPPRLRRDAAALLQDGFGGATPRSRAYFAISCAIASPIFWMSRCVALRPRTNFAAAAYGFMVTTAPGA